VLRPEVTPADVLLLASGVALAADRLSAPLRTGLAAGPDCLSAA
jgi:hypothetical protein